MALIDLFMSWLGKMLKWGMPSTDNDPEIPVVVASEAPTSPVVPSLPSNPIPMTYGPDSIVYPWDSPKHNYHNVRVLCDKSGLSVPDKDVICACVMQESQFYNYLPNGSPVKFENKDPNTGHVWSTDWGIVQINDHFHIGSGKDFPSVDYVLQNPDKAVQYMIDMFKAGKLSLWSSYKSGAYRKWLLTGSSMWDLSS